MPSAMYVILYCALYINKNEENIKDKCFCRLCESFGEMSLKCRVTKETKMRAQQSKNSNKAKYEVLIASVKFFDKTAGKYR